MQSPQNEQQSNPWDPNTPISDQDSGTAANYVSSPFRVFLDSFKKLFSVNLSLLLKLYGTFLLTLLVLFLLIIAFTAAGPRLPEGSKVIIFVIGAVAVIGMVVWALIFTTAIQWYAVMTTRNEQASFKQALSVGYRKWPGLFVVNLLRSLAIFVGLILLIIPGLVFAYWFSLAAYAYIDSDMGPVDSLKHSRALVKGKAAEIIGLFGASGIFSLPATIPLLGFVYSLAYTPANKIAFAYRYSSAERLAKSGDVKPATNPANYVAIFLLPLVFVLMMAIGVATSDQSTNNELYGYIISLV